MWSLPRKDGGKKGPLLISSEEGVCPTIGDSPYPIHVRGSRAKQAGV